MGVHVEKDEVVFTPGKHIPALDGIRGIAILLVVVFHYICCMLEPGSDSFLLYIRGMLGLTWSGVDLFFVLSGFLITGILVDNIGAENYYKVFYLRRVCRIFPLYYLVIILFALGRRMGLAETGAGFGWLFDGAMPLWSYALFLQNISMAEAGSFGANFLGMLWSLSVEEQFYLLFPFLVSRVSRRTLAGVVCLFIFIPPILREGAGFGAVSLMPCRADTLMVGALIALGVRSGSLFELLVRNRTSVYTAFAGLLGGAALLTRNGGAFGCFNYTWLAFLYGTFLLIPLLHPEGLPGRLLRTGWLRKIGGLAYGIYIFHMPVLGLMHGFILGKTPLLRTGTDALVTGAAFGVTLAVALLSHELVEKRVLAMGRRIPYIAREGGGDATAGRVPGWGTGAAGYLRSKKRISE